MIHNSPAEVDVVPGVRLMMWSTAAAFVVVEVSIRAFNLYFRAPWVDIPSHFFSGAAVTAAFLNYLTGRQRGGALQSMGGNVLVALAWEAAEMVDEVLTPDPPHLKDVFFWDGFWDVVFAVVGGAVVLWVLRRRGPQPQELASGSSRGPSHRSSAGS